MASEYESNSHSIANMFSASAYALELRPSKEFKFETGKNKLVNLHLKQANGSAVQFVVPEDYDLSAHPGLEHEETGTQEHLLRLLGWLDISCEITVGCASAVLSYLRRRRVATFLPQAEMAQEFFRVTSVEMFSIKDAMFINMDTLISLQIIDTESHPNAQNQGPTTSRAAKEGFSIYGLFHHLAKTSQGKQKLRTCFLRPSKNIEVIYERLDAVSALSLPSNSEYIEEFVQSLRNIKNIRALLKNMRKGASGPDRGGTSSVPLWSRLIQFVYEALEIKDTMKKMQGIEQTVIYAKVMDKFESSVLTKIGKSISAVIDLEESKIAQRAVVHRGIDEDLDEKKMQYDGLESYLVEVAKYIKSKLPITFQQMEQTPIDVGYYPRIGFVLQIDEHYAEELEIHSATLGSTWQHVFTAQYV
jgi:DNA mismatch repair protein MSH5